MEANETPVDHLPGLLPHHLTRLRESGLSDATIVASGITSETNADSLRACLGWDKPPKKLVPAIKIPHHDAHGNNSYCRFRPDTPRRQNGRGVKYESPKGRPNQIYIPPGIVLFLHDATVDLHITEGEFKALAATQHGVRCIGLCGVLGWKPKGQEKLLAELEQINWTGRKVCLHFDSDIVRKEDIQDAESRLAKHLTDRGAKVRCVRYPDGPVGEDGKPVKVGLDDYVVANGQVALCKLIDEAVDPELPTGPEIKEDASRIDPGAEAKAYLRASEFDGVPRIRFWKGSWWRWSHGAYRERDQAEIRADLMRNLDHTYKNIGSGIVSCIIDHAKAHSILMGEVEPGDWIADAAVKWPANETLVTRSQLVHLPSLITGQLATLAVTPRLFSVSALDFDFELAPPRPDAWFTFLDTLWPTDTEAVSTLQEFIGYLLTANTKHQKILLVVGPKRAGKGTLARVIRGVVGRQNCAGPTLAGLAGKFGLASLLGKSVAIVSDARLGGQTDRAIVTERLLSISGEDFLGVDRKFLPTVDCKLPTRFVICSNELPRLSDSRGRTRRRT